MTKRQGKSGTIDVKALLAEDGEFLRSLMRTAIRAQFHDDLGSVRCFGVDDKGLGDNDHVFEAALLERLARARGGAVTVGFAGDGRGQRDGSQAWRRYGQPGDGQFRCGSRLTTPRPAAC